MPVILVCDSGQKYNPSDADRSYTLDVQGNKLTINSDKWTFNDGHKYVDFYILAEIDSEVVKDYPEIDVINNAKITFKDEGVDKNGNPVDTTTPLIDKDAVVPFNMPLVNVYEKFEKREQYKKERRQEHDRMHGVKVLKK